MLDSKLESLRIGEDRPFGVEVIHKDGSKDCYDPLTEHSIGENETQYLFDNGHYIYSEQKEGVAKLRRYELCLMCGYSVEHCHCPDTEEASR